MRRWNGRMELNLFYLCKTCYWKDLGIMTGGEQRIREYSHIPDDRINWQVNNGEKIIHSVYGQYQHITQKKNNKYIKVEYKRAYFCTLCVAVILSWITVICNKSIWKKSLNLKWIALGNRVIYWLQNFMRNVS